MRLNGWQRIGGVASCLWVPYGAMHGANLAFDGRTDLSTEHALMAFYAVAPVLAAWFAAWCIVVSVRWIARGFR